MLTDQEIDTLCSEWLYVAPGRTYEEHRPFARAIESAATAPLLAEIERLTRELEEARRDAEMYRWLRDYHIGDDPESINLKKAKTKGLDAAIRAAIKEQT